MNFEEEIQKQVEQGKPHDSPVDDGSKAYSIVFKSLRNAPEFAPSPDLADTVMKRIKKQQTMISNDYLWFGAGLLVLLSSAVVTILLTGFKLDLGFLKSISAYNGLFIFGAAFIAMLNWIDRRLIRTKRSVM